MDTQNEVKIDDVKKNSFATGGFVLGIIGIIFSILPFVNVLAMIMGILAVIFGIIGAIKKRNRGVAIAAVVLGILALVISYNVTNTTVNGINNAVNEINTDVDKIAGNSTEEVLANEVDVVFGEFVSETNDYGYGLTDMKTELPVTIQNKSEESKSFTITIEAVNENGDRITTDTVYASSLSSGQSYETKAFTYISNETAQNLTNATFKVLEVASY